jgi:hypothetical protein
MLSPLFKQKYRQKKSKSVMIRKELKRWRDNDFSHRCRKYELHIWNLC